MKVSKNSPGRSLPKKVWVIYPHVTSIKDNESNDKPEAHKYEIDTNTLKVEVEKFINEAITCFPEIGSNEGYELYDSRQRDIIVTSIPCISKRFGLDVNNGVEIVDVFKETYLYVSAKRLFGFSTDEEPAARDSFPLMGIYEKCVRNCNVCTVREKLDLSRMLETIISVSWTQGIGTFSGIRKLDYLVFLIPSPIINEIHSICEKSIKDYGNSESLTEICLLPLYDINKDTSRDSVIDSNPLICGKDCLKGINKKHSA